MSDSHTYHDMSDSHTYHDMSDSHTHAMSDSRTYRALSDKYRGLLQYVPSSDHDNVRSGSTIQYSYHHRNKRSAVRTEQGSRTVRDDGKIEF